MADVQSNIKVSIDTSEALAQLKLLQREISAFHSSMAKTGAAGTAVSANMQQNLLNSINSSGKFYAEMTRIKTTTEAFSTALAKNQFSMKEYFRYAGAATQTFGKLFAQEHETINKVARENVKTLQTQYIKLGRDANGALQGISVRPLSLDMNNLQTQTALAAQKQALLNQLLRQGSTNLLNFGKNTQWAGRQLMVGFTVPLMYFGSVAGKTFMQLEEQAIRFKRVYGDMFTSNADTNKALKDVQNIANQFTQYGVAVADTMSMAADVAATGKMGADLMAQVTNANKLAVLGGIDQKKSLDTIISLTSTFGIATNDLSKNIDFLNAVENQTILNIDDLTTAIPKAAPVVKQLGGNVQDLAFFMTAMREGGIDAAQGANAIKSALASMINPTKAAKDMLGGFGIDVVGLVNADKGNVKKMVLDLASAFNTLDPMNRAKAIEAMFGKFQFARVSTLMQNVIKEGSQAQTVLGLTKATTEELAILSERELKKVSDSPMYKFKKQVQDLKTAIAPIGGEFIKALTPVLKFFGGIFEKFNNLSDGSKHFIVMLTTILAGIGPLVLMSFGLLANGVANIIKLFVGVKSLFNGVGKSSAGLGEQTNYLTQQQMENAASAASLDQAHQRLEQRFTAEAEAIKLLVLSYEQAIAAQRMFAMSPMPTGMRPGIKLATGGIISGPGTGTSDSIPAMLSNGEAVVPAENVKKFPELTSGLVSGNIPGFAEGYSPGGYPQYRAIANRGVMQEVIRRNQEFAASQAAAASAAAAKMSAETAMIAVKTSSVGRQLGNIGVGSNSFAFSNLANKNTSVKIQELINKTTGQIDESIVAALTKLQSETKVTVVKFKEEVAAQAKALGQSVPADLMLSRSQSRVRTTRYSAPSGLGSVRDQLIIERGFVAANAELERAETSARAMATTLSDLGFSSKQIDAAIQLDRSHMVAMSNNAKKLSEAWHSSLWMTQTSGENNGIANSLAMSAKNRKIYENALKELGVDTETQAALMSKINQNIGLTEKELFIQGNVLRKIADDAAIGLISAKEISPKFAAYAKAVADGADARLIMAQEQGIALENATIRTTEEVSARVAKLAAALPEGAAESLAVASPSRKMRTIGEQGGEGLIVGAKEALANSQAVGRQLGASAVPMPAGSQARNAVALYGTGPVDAEAKSVRRQLETVAKRQLAESKIQLALDEKISQSKQQLYGTTGQITQDMRTQRRLAESQAKALLVAQRERMLAEEELATQTKSNGFISNMLEKLKQKALRDRAVAEEGAARGGMGGKLMGVSMLAMAGSMLPGALGQLSQKIMMATMAMAAFEQIMPMMTTPVGAAVTAFVAIGAAVWKLRSEFDSTRASVMKLHESIGASTNSLRQLSVGAGKVTAGEAMDRARANALQPYNVQSGKSTYGESFVQSENGKATLKNLQGLMVQNGKVIAGGSDAAAQSLTSQLMAAVTSGALTKAQADSIAANMAVKLGDAGLGIKIRAKLDSVLGPNGENLLTDPLEIRLKVMQNQQNSANQATRTLNNNKIGGFMSTKIATTGSIAASAGAGALTGAIIGGSIPILGETGVGEAIGAVVGTIVGSIGGYFKNRANNKKMAALAGAAVAEQTMALQQNKEQLDSLDLYYQKKVDELKIQGQLVKAEEAQTRWTTERNKLVKEAAGYNKTIIDQYNQAGGNQEALLNGAKNAVKDKWKGTNSAAFVDAAQNMLGDARSNGGLNSGQEYLLTLKMSTGELDPQQVLNLIDPNNNEQTTKVMEIVTKFGSTTANQMSQIAGMFVDINGKPIDSLKTKFIATIAGAKTDKEAQDIMNLYADVAKGGGVYSADVAISFIDGNNTLRDQLIKDFKSLEDAVDKGVNIDVIYNIDQKLKGNIDETYFKNLSKDDKKKYLKTVETLVNIPAAKITGSASYIKWLGESGKYGGKDFKGKESDVKLISRYIEDMAYDVTKTGDQSTALPPGASGSGSTNTPTASPLDDLIKKVRDLRKDQQGLTVGWDASMKAMNALFTNAKGKVQNLVPTKGQSPFNGMENQLRKQGLAQGGIDFLTGLSPDDYAKVGSKFIEIDKKTGAIRLKNAQQLNALINNIAVGEFVNANEKIITSTRNQDVAIKKLIGAGMSLDNAYAAVSDEAFAAAIATGKFDAATIKAMVSTKNQADSAAKLAEQLKAARTYFNNFSIELTDQKTYSQLAGQLKTMGMDADMISNILSDPNVAKGLIEEFKNGEVTAQTILETVQKIKDLTLQKAITDMQAGNYSAAFQPGYDAAQKMFDIQQRLLEQSYRPLLKIDQDRIDAAQKLADAKQKEIDAQQKNVDIAQAEVDAANKLIETQNTRNDKLNHDLTLIDHATQAINDKYDAQKQALQEIASVNDYIIGQQGKQLTLADSLTQGDIGAAAKAVQDMRSASATNAISVQQKALDAAQANQIANLKNDEGKTKLQIEQEQWTISETIYGIQQNQLKVAQSHLDAANALLTTKQNELKVLQDSVTSAQATLDADKARLDTETQALTVLGQTKQQWDDMKLKIDAAQLAQDELATTQMAAALATAKLVDSKWSGILDYYKQYKDKTVTITTLVQTIYSAVSAPAPTSTPAPSPMVSYNPTTGLSYNPNGTPPPAAPAAPTVTSADIIAARKAQYGYLSKGGIVPKYFAVGGYAKGTDTVPAMLTPGEFVMSKYAVNTHGVDTLSAMNKGDSPANAVYTYNLSVNVKSDANPNDIARVVMTQIKQIDSQRVRGVGK